MSRLLGILVLAVSLSGLGCSRVDLAQALSVTEVVSGWHYVGVVDGLNKMVPSITFKLSNVGDAAVSRVQLLVSFWRSAPMGRSTRNRSKASAPLSWLRLRQQSLSS
jgi:hypothetical protein